MLCVSMDIFTNCQPLANCFVVIYVSELVVNLFSGKEKSISDAQSWQRVSINFLIN